MTGYYYDRREDETPSAVADGSRIMRRKKTSKKACIS